MTAVVGLSILAVAASRSAVGQTPIVSMGQPPRWLPYLGATFNLTGLSGPTAIGGGAFFGVQKPLLNPIAGGPAFMAEGYLGAGGEPIGGVDGGLRAGLALPILFTQFGLDWNLRTNRAQFVMSAVVPPIRGGLFGRGGQLRLDWIPARNQTLQFGVTVPVGQRWAGRTRPRTIDVPLPRPPRAERGRAELDSEGRRHLARVTSYGLRVTKWAFPISWTEGASYQDALRLAESTYTALAASLTQGDSLSPTGHSAPSDHAIYLRETDRLFGWAAGEQRRGAEIGDSARAAVLDAVWLPYNRLMAQYRTPDQLFGLGIAARARFAAWVEGPAGLAQDQRALVLAAYDAWFASLDDLRAWLLARGRNDTRGTWLPMHLVLRPEQHDTRPEVDELIRRAVGNGFQGGNAAVYISGQQFQTELHHQITVARRYHVLWLHDYRGMTPAGYPDLVGYYQTAESYLAALTARVREYDRTGVLPAFLLFLDQNYYQANNGRVWLTVLEDPLQARVRIPAPPKKPRVTPELARQFLSRADSLERRLSAWQDSLRAAVASSVRLQREAAAGGGDRWIRRMVKVHVNITQPFDLTFRTSRLLGLPVAGDNLIRDHRKIAFYDVTEQDPGIGGAMYAGVGVGETYASATWEDRALMVQGPALLPLKAAARQLLLANGFSAEQVPPALREEPVPADYSARVAALEARGASARMLQAHNRVGFAQKDATVVQMLLYDLMPPNSVIYVPDSIWTSFLWTGQLVAAAFRGCHVYIVAPAQANAPAAGFPTLSRTQELFAQLVVISRVLSEPIERVGGRLRVGLYSRQSGVNDMPASFREITAALARNPWIRDEFKLGDTFFQDFARVADSLDRAGFTPAGFVGEETARAPKMHRKTQFFASREMLDLLAAEPEVRHRFRDDMRGGVRSREQPPATANLVADPRVAAEAPLFEAFGGLPASIREAAPLYLTVGSLNKDWRGAALDGEALAVVSGQWALIGWIDFFYLAGHTTWLDRVEEFERLMPPYSNRQRWIGRRLRNII